MAVGRAERREDRKRRFAAAFGEDGGAVALDLMELIELAWHDCYGEVTPPEGIVDDMLLLSEGSIERFIHFGRLGVTDWRDLKVAAEALRS